MADNCLTLEAFWLETQALTRALQMSLSDDSSASSPPLLLPPPAPLSAPRRTPLASGRISKRKSRASRRSTTTFITADPANFRAMVQQVTGVRFVEPTSEPVLRPEPQRSGYGFGLGQQSCLPTLDTSALLLDREGGLQQSEPDGRDGSDGVGLGFEPVMSFPTLESWRVV